MTAAAYVTVEPVPAEHRHDELASVPWVVCIRTNGPPRMEICLPTSTDEWSLHPVDFGAKVAAERGLEFVEPPWWQVFWPRRDSRGFVPHNLLLGDAPLIWPVAGAA